MTEAKHTPGPWKFSEYHRAVVQSERSVDGCNLEICKIGNSQNITHPMVAADARLIAAAPGMLEALKELLCEWDQRQEFSLQDNSEYLPDTTGIVWARQSVALATGMEE